MSPEEIAIEFGIKKNRAKVLHQDAFIKIQVDKDLMDLLYDYSY